MSNAVDKWKGKMRRSTTGEAVEALLSGTAIAPAKENEGSPKKSQVEVATAHEEAAATIAAPISEPISLPSRKKFEETHTRSTFYVENELLDILNSVAVEKGQKTYIINEALRRFLAAIQQS